jgi:hypothetical protein
MIAIILIGHIHMLNVAQTADNQGNIQ